MLENPFYHNEDAKAERSFLRKVIAVLGAVCFLVLIALATDAHAQDIPLHVLDKDGITISLMGGACEDTVSLGLIKKEFHARAKALRSVWPERDGSRKVYAGCWIELTKKDMGIPEDKKWDGAFLVVFSDGESGVIPKTEFKKVRGQVGV
jgi:hypothetical protein